MTYQENKESMILSAIDLLRKKGYEVCLKNKQNGHLQVRSRHNIVYNFYPTTGTIAGYDFDKWNGIDALLFLLDAR